MNGGKRPRWSFFVKLSGGVMVIGGLLAACIGETDQALIERGRYLVTVGNCTDCHTDGFLLGQPSEELYLAGAQTGFYMEGLGVMYPPNLTPDPETGLGGWTREDIVRALKEGVRPDGGLVRPPMPIVNTSQLTDEDAYAMAAFLKSLPPVRHEVPANPVPRDQAKRPYYEFVFPDG